MVRMEKRRGVCALLFPVWVCLAHAGVQSVFSVCVQSSHSHLDFKHSQLRREREEREWGKERSSPERSSWNGINGTDIPQDPLE